MYKVGTRKDAEAIRGKVPDEVYREIFQVPRYFVWVRMSSKLSEVV